MTSKNTNDIKVNPVEGVYMSYLFSFIALSGTIAITFIGSLNYDFDGYEYDLRAAFISETAVNFIAGIVYSYITKLLFSGVITLEQVTPIRYFDWVLTTPLLLLSFALYSNYSENKENGTDNNTNLEPLSYIVFLNLGMLLFGYLGETGKIGKYSGLIIGFLFYTGLFVAIYENYIKNSTESNKSLFYVFAFVWALYGFSYLLGPFYKNISYNCLDVVSKAGFGIYMWLGTINEITSSAKMVKFD